MSCQIWRVRKCIGVVPMSRNDEGINGEHRAGSSHVSNVQQAYCAGSSADRLTKARLGMQLSCQKVGFFFGKTSTVFISHAKDLLFSLHTCVQTSSVFTFLITVKQTLLTLCHTHLQQSTSTAQAHKAIGCLT